LPDRSTHRRTSRDILGDDFDYVHKWKDEPVTQLGANHRDVRHGPLSAYKAGNRFKGSGIFNFGAAAASIIHDLEDGHVTTWLAVILAVTLGAAAVRWSRSRAGIIPTASDQSMSVSLV
jgi:hypothetical protein